MTFGPGVRGTGKQDPWPLWCLMAAMSFCGVALAAEAAGKHPSERPSGSFALPKEQPVEVELIAEHATFPSNDGTHVGVFFKLQEGWHIYAEDPGDAGLPTKITWESLPGVHFGPIVWPPAKELHDPGNIKTFGYTGSVLLASALTYVARESVPELPITAHVEWLACKELCIPGKADLHLTLPVSASSEPPQLSAHAALFEIRDSH